MTHDRCCGWTTSTSSAPTWSRCARSTPACSAWSCACPTRPVRAGSGYRAGDVVIYFIEEDAATGPPHAAPRFTGAQNPPGIDSFAFEVDDLDAAIAQLDGARGQPGRGRSSSSEWYRYRGLHDPEGNLVYLTEPLLDRSDPPVPAPGEAT